MITTTRPISISPAVFLTRMLFALSAYLALLPVFESIRTTLPTDSLISFFFILLFFLVAWSSLAKDGSDFAAFGMTLQGWPRQLARSLWLTSPLLLLVFGLKWAYVGAHPEQLELFEPEQVLKGVGGASWIHWVLFAGMYVLLSFAQELVRCVTQGSLARFYRDSGEPDNWRSLVVTNMVFAATHVHLSAWFALMAFLPGLFWGWLYQRERSYLAVGFSHALVGCWALFVLGVPA